MLTILLGASHAVITVSDPLEYDIERVFHACNRINTTPDDVWDIYQTGSDMESVRWLAELRYAIDIVHAPSMSVGDCIYVQSNTGQLVACHICERTGWTHVTPAGFDLNDYRAELNGRHVHHIITPQGATPCRP